MILTLIGLRLDPDTIQEKILNSPIVPSLDEVFAQLLHHSSTTTRSLPLDSTPNSSMMISQSNFQSDSRGGRGGS